jgi:hypothetical protein
MHHKTPRPAPLFRATRAGSEFLGGRSDRKDSILDRQTLAAALRSGATILVGQRQQEELTLDHIQPILARLLPFDDYERVLSLAAPFAFCWHWLSFTGRQVGLSRKYPVVVLQEYITTCFGLNHTDVPMDAVLTALVANEFEVAREKPVGCGFIWTTNIRAIARVRDDQNGIFPRVPLCSLRAPGSLPPILIEERPQ